MLLKKGATWKPRAEQIGITTKYVYNEYILAD